MATHRVAVLAGHVGATESAAYVAAKAPRTDRGEARFPGAKIYPDAMTTPLDVRMGLTKEEDVNYKLRWGIIGASAIASDWIKSLQDVPGAEVAAVAARDPAKAQEYADVHGIPKVHRSYQQLVDDPAVDIVYISSKTWDHYDHLMMCIKARKHILCEKPFTDTAEQAREVYAAADRAGVFCQEGMWTRFFPAFEHARAEIDSGTIGDIVSVQCDYPDRVYALTPAPFAFGTDEQPKVAALGKKPFRSPNGPGGAKPGPFSAHGTTPSAAVLQYGRRGVATILFSAGRFTEVTHITGTKGRITIECPSHHPTSLTVHSGRPPLRPRTDGKKGPPIVMGKLGYEVDWDGQFSSGKFGIQGDTNCPSHGPFGYVERFDYRLPTPEPRLRGQPAGQRWTGEKLIKYKGWNWHGGNQHGFMYQAQAIHRVMATWRNGPGLKECPQFTRKESLQVCQIIDEVNQQCADNGY